jgi:hypothetical protein
MTREVTITVEDSTGEAELVSLAVDGRKLDLATHSAWKLYRPVEICADTVLSVVDRADLCTP